MKTLLLSLILVVFALTACGGDDDDTSTSPVFTAGDSGTEILLEAGEQFELMLESNPSTGYSWEVMVESAPGVELQTRRFEAGDTDLVGAAGTEVFVFQAIEGAGVLRLEYVRPFEDPVIPERVAEYVIRVDESPWPPTDVVVPGTTTVSAPPVTSAPAIDGPMEIGAMLADSTAREVAVSGYVVWDESGARLCEVLMESFPPQCGGERVAIMNPDVLDLELTENQGIRWTDDRIVLDARFDGIELILDQPVDPNTPTMGDKMMVAAFEVFASDPSTAALSELPFASEVALGLGETIEGRFSVAALADRSAWTIERDEFRAYAGPFSALDLTGHHYEITVGEHDRCIDGPVPAPAGFDGHRRVSIQPTDATSCLEWSSIDFFLNSDGLIEAVTLDLYGP